MAVLQNFTFRAHEWLADRVSWVQYPRIKPLAPKRPLFGTKMPLENRLMLVLFGLGCLLAAAIVGTTMLFIVWAAITA